MPVSSADPALLEQLRRLHRELGISPDYAAQRGLTIQPEAHSEELVPIATTADDRPILLAQSAAGAWQRLRRAAETDGVTLIPLSGFRSVARQTGIIQEHLARGRSLADLLANVAAPGFSEHHTGRALDLDTPGCPNLDEAFAQTAAYSWLETHATAYGFHLSYPRGNPHGIVYEPWHWCWQG